MISVVEGDITDQEVDAIVNAANTELILGDGVAGAIRTRGGPQIAAECEQHGPVALGEAAVTGAGELRARWVIHAATMVRGSQADEASVRASLRSALMLAAQRGCRRLAVPALGTGVGGLALQRCAEISLEEARAHLEQDTPLEEIRFVLFGEPAYRVFEAVHDAARIAEQMERVRRR